MRKYCFRKPTNEETAAIQSVLDELEKYKGEKIVAYEHPLHASIAALERFCMKRGTGQGRQPYDLHPPARFIWYGMLDRSRGGARRFSMWEPKNPLSNDDPATPEMTKKWAGALSLELNKWLTDFPFIEKRV